MPISSRTLLKSFEVSIIASCISSIQKLSLKFLCKEICRDNSTIICYPLIFTPKGDENVEIVNDEKMVARLMLSGLEVPN